MDRWADDDCPFQFCCIHFFALGFTFLPVQLPRRGGQPLSAVTNLRPSYVPNCTCKILDHPSYGHAPNCMYPFCRKHPPILPKMAPKITRNQIVSDKILNFKNSKRIIFGPENFFFFHRQDLTNFWQKCRHLGQFPKKSVWGTPFYHHTCIKGHFPKCTILRGTPRRTPECIVLTVT